MVERDLDHVGGALHRAHSATQQRVGRDLRPFCAKSGTSCRFVAKLLPAIRFWGIQMRTLTLLASLMCMALSVNAAKADRRVAFVVGNGTYKNVAQLPNPPIDAKAMAATLRNVGFEVIEGSNLTRDQMTEKLLDFGRKAQGSDVAVFYYAGHGIAVGGSNYLLPIDADIKSEMDVKLGAAINIDLTLEQTMGDAKVKLVFLDACRDNPFAAKIKSNS